MGMFEEQLRREEAAREARRRSNEEAVQSAFIQGFKPQYQRPLELVQGDGPLIQEPPVSSHPPGVFREPGTPEGLVVFVGYGLRGERRFRHEMLAEDEEPETVGRLERGLAARDPARKLKAI